MSYPSMFHPVTSTFDTAADGSMSVGQVFVEGSNEYVFVKNVDATTISKGCPAFMGSTTYGEVAEIASRIGLAPASGAACADIAAGDFGFILRKGLANYLVGNTGTASGEPVFGGATDIWDTATIGTHHIAGYALTDDTASVFTGVIDCI